MPKKPNSFSQFDGAAGTSAAKKSKPKARSSGRVAGEPRADNRSTMGITEEGVLKDMREHRRRVRRMGVE